MLKNILRSKSSMLGLFMVMIFVQLFLFHLGQGVGGEVIK